MRVEWERRRLGARRRHYRGGTRQGALLCWRLHALLGQLTGQATHYYQATQTRPDLPPAQAALGHLLLRQGQAAEAVAHLRLALDGNPFDRATAQALYQALGAAGTGPGSTAWRTTACCCTGRRRPWSRPSPGSPTAPQAFPPQKPRRAAVRVAWEGACTSCTRWPWSTAPGRPACQRRRGPVPAADRPDHRRGLAGRRWPRVAGGTVRPRGRARAAPVAAELGPAFARPLGGLSALGIRQPAAPGFAPWRSRWTRSGSSAPTPAAASCRAACRPSASCRARRRRRGGADPAAPPCPLRTEKKFRFLFVGGTIARKGFDLLLAAYAAPSTARRRRAWWSRTWAWAPFTGSDRRGPGRTAPGRPERAAEVEYLDRPLTDEEWPACQSCHCLVPYRGEGFGLPLAEAMACGLPVVVTGHGAALDFCTAENAYLVPAREAYFAADRVGDLETVGRPWLAEPDPDWLALPTPRRRAPRQSTRQRARPRPPTSPPTSPGTGPRTGSRGAAAPTCRGRPARRPAAGAPLHSAGRHRPPCGVGRCGCR